MIYIACLLSAAVGFLMSQLACRGDRREFMRQIQERRDALRELERWTERRYRELRVQLGIPPDRPS